MELYKEQLSTNGSSKREHLFDFYRSVFMLFTFIHHAWGCMPHGVDYTNVFNPYAELFIGLSGFMIGYVYLRKEDYSPLLKKGIIILVIYYVIAIMKSIGCAMIGVDKSSVGKAIWDTIIMMADYSSIGILRFYAIIFMITPAILWLYKKYLVCTLFLSVVIFVISTFVYWNYIYLISNYFINNTFMLLIQWQLFFVLGIVLGEMHRKNKLTTMRINMTLLLLFFVCFIFKALDLENLNYTKFPYTFNKLINFLYAGPIVLYIFYYVYRLLQGTILDEYVRVIGRNSLVAFVFSEIFLQPIILFFILYPNWSHNIYLILVILFAYPMFLLFSLWRYEKAFVTSTSYTGVLIK